jgi:hypothetical protein
MVAMNKSIVMLLTTCLATAVLPGCSNQDLECRTDLDCMPGHLCTREHVCTENEITTMQECIEVRPAVREGRSSQRGRYTIFLVVPGKRSDEIFARNIRRMAWDSSDPRGLDVFVRVVVPDSTVAAGARFAQPVGVEGLVLTKENSDLEEALVQTVAGLPEENSRATLKAGLWALEQVASGEIQDNHMGVVVYILDDGDDCSTTDASGSCSADAGLVDLASLADSYSSAVAQIQEISTWTLLSPVLRPIVLTYLVTPGENGCTANELSYEATPRYHGFAQLSPGLETGSEFAGEDFCHEFWKTDFGQYVFTEYDQMHPNESLTRFVFSYMPASQDLIFVFLNSVLMEQEDITYLHLTFFDQQWGFDEDAHLTPEDIWNGFNQDLWQNLQIIDIQGSAHWGDSLEVVYCPLYHTETPMLDSLVRVTNYGE